MAALSSNRGRAIESLAAAKEAGITPDKADVVEAIMALNNGGFERAIELAEKLRFEVRCTHVLNEPNPTTARHSSILLVLSILLTTGKPRDTLIH